jgi:hypothetical protein
MVKDVYHKIIDNILPESFLDELITDIESPLLSWRVSSEYDFSHDYKFNHILKDHGFEPSDLKFNNQNVLHFRDNSGYMKEIASVPKMYELLDMLKVKLDVLIPLRLKLNMTFCGDVQRSYGWHIDESELYSLPTKTAILYLNANNGYTLLEDGTKIESVKNRLLIIDGNTFHTPINQTDTDTRLVLNYNFI